MFIHLHYGHTNDLYKCSVPELAGIIIHHFLFIQDWSRILASHLLFYSISLPNNMNTVFLDTISKRFRSL